MGVYIYIDSCDRQNRQWGSRVWWIGYITDTMNSWYDDLLVVNVRSPLPTKPTVRFTGVVNRIHWPLNWKRFVATACESYQSGIQPWRMVDGLLWTFFIWFWLWWHKCSLQLLIIRMKSGDGGIDLTVYYMNCTVYIQNKDHTSNIGKSYLFIL